jgi:hypothetical protein
MKSKLFFFLNKVKLKKRTYICIQVYFIQYTIDIWYQFRDFGLINFTVIWYQVKFFLFLLFLIRIRRIRDSNIINNNSSNNNKMGN